MTNIKNKLFITILIVLSTILMEIHVVYPQVLSQNSTTFNLSLQSGSFSNNAKLNLFGNIGNNVLQSFKGNNAYFHLLAITSTYILVNTNVDFHVEQYFNRHAQYGNWTRPVAFSGEILPIVAGAGLLTYSEMRNDKEILGASFAVIQSSLIELVYNSALKAVTGRPNPNWRCNCNMDSLSKVFRFGFLRGGLFWGWPSGHTAATMAVISALTNYYPDKTWLKVAGYGLVAYTMFGVSSINRGGMHWFSDAVAGALMSYAIGSTVGKYFRTKYNEGYHQIPSASTDNLQNFQRIPQEDFSFPILTIAFDI